MDEAELELEQLDFEIYSPEVKITYDDLYELEADLNAERLTRAEAVERLREIDASWPYYGEQMNITGRVHSYVNFNGSELTDTLESEEGSEKTIFNQYVSDLSVVSYGFVINSNNIETQQDFEIDSSESYSIAHAYYITGYSSATDGFISSQHSFYGLSMLGEVVTTFPETQEDSIDLVNFYKPDLLEDVDTCVLNQETRQDAALSLKGMQIELNKETDADYINGLERHANKIVELEVNLPDLVTVKDVFYSVDELAELAPARVSAAAGGKATFGGYMERLCLIPQAAFINNEVLEVDVNTQVWAIVLKLQSKNKENNANATTVVIPVDSIAKIESLQDLYDSSVDI